ncbi:MAG: PHP domain-containing protein [Clostridia bacterium]|nr:PHP domain-containing protein [Clostridia bacterium]
MKYFKYETHLHTAEVSACGRASAKEQVEFYSELGFSGICITDHFFNGNTTVPRNGITWEEKVELFCRGYVNAKSAAEKTGLDVFFGWEYSYSGTDILTYGLSPEWLLENPQIMEMYWRDYCDFVREEGGVVIHAHPFREENYIKEIRLIPRNVNGAEVINCGQAEFFNKRADEYADNYGLIKTAGSDNHTAFAQKNIAGIKTKTKIKSSAELAEIIKNGDFKIFRERVK